MTVKDLMALLDRDYVLQGRRSLPVMRIHARHIMSKIGEVQAEKLTRSIVDNYKEGRLKESAAKGTINLELAYLHRACKLALEDESLEKMPVIKQFPIDNARQDFIVPEEFRKLTAAMEVLDADVADALYFLYFLGWRRREVFELTWKEVEVGAGRLLLPPMRNKTGDLRRIKLDENLSEVLVRRWAKRAEGCPFVFHRKGRQIKSFEGPWERMRKLLGKPDLQVHGLRRSMANNGIQAGLPEKLIMDLGGWRTRSTFDRYCITNDEQQAAGIARISAYVKAKQKQKGQT